MTAQLKVRLALVCAAELLACNGSILSPSFKNRPVGAAPVCAPPSSHPVSKLLRTSNVEYQQMVSDLLGLQLTTKDFARWPPIAQVYGFDTMNASAVDPQGLQEQLRTVEMLSAEYVKTQAFAASCPALPAEQSPACTLKNSYDSTADFSSVQGQSCWSYLDSAGTALVFDPAPMLWRNEPDVGLHVWNNGAHPGASLDSVRRWTAPVDATLDLSGTFSIFAGEIGDGVTVSVKGNSGELWRTVLPIRTDSAFSLRAVVKRGDTIDFVVNRTSNADYDSTGFHAAIALTPTPVTRGWTWENCAKPALTTLASRAFRRPLRPDELTDYQTQFNASLGGATAAGLASPFNEALTTSAQSVLLSPNFTFKPELISAAVDTAEKPFAVASKLALFFRGSLPDETLWTAALNNELNAESSVRAQAQRLLAANQTRFTQNFGGQWLDFRDAEETLDPLMLSMQAEPAAIFQEVLRSDLPAERLLSPGFTFADARLAKHYGLFNYKTANGGVQRLFTNERGGLLSQGAFLVRTAKGSEFRRPIYRGLWTLTRLLCETLPRLDRATLEEIAMSTGSIDPALPLPKKMELHRSATARCIGCHGKIDPIGLALEKYDERGMWRDFYASGAPIENDFAYEGVSTKNPQELNALLEGSTAYRSCVATKLLTFALNRGPLEDEACVAQTMSATTQGQAPTLQSMAVESIVQSFHLSGVTP
jgi:hypothetical protein